MVLHVRAGVNPAKIVICHTDIDIDLTYIKALLDKGQHQDKTEPKSSVCGEPSPESLIGGDAVETLYELL
jgi:hypothetical protein